MAEATSLWFSAPRTVEYRSESLPDTGPGEVRIQTIASAISHGTEMLVYRGEVPKDMSLDLPTLAGSFGFPIKYGYASVGRVLEAGAGVQGLDSGDLVFTHHPHQTEYVVPADLPVRLPASTLPEQAVFLANIETAINILLDAAPKLGERVVVFGAGVVGLLVTKLLERSGVEWVVTVDGIPRRRMLAEALRATVALAPNDDVQGRVRDMSDGVGADLVIEVSGSPQALPRAIECAATQGTVVIASWYGSKEVTLRLGDAFHRRRLRLVSSQVGSIDPALAPRWDRQRRLNLALALLPDLHLDDIISHRIPFRDARRAYELIDKHPEDTTQVVLTYGEDGV